MTKELAQGVISHDAPSTRHTDYLYRISLKGLVRNALGEILVVKETDRDYWDLPGGGMDHGEDIKAAIAREMKEEVNMQGDFTYRVIDVDDPSYLRTHDFWQLRLVFEVTPENMSFSPGEDADEVAFVSPESLKNSDNEVEQYIYHYSSL
jgi:8-oxo-dGTP diphosphatase